MADLFNMTNSGCNDIHTQVLGLQSKVGPDHINWNTVELYKAARHIDKRLQQLARHVGQQGAGHHHGGDKHTQGILEHKVMQNVKHLSGEKRQLRPWRQTLTKALSTIMSASKK